MSRRRRGLTLLEVTMALALLTTVLACVFAALSVAARADIAAHEHRVASDAAFLELERRLASDYEGLAASGPQAFHVEYDAGQGRVRLAPASAVTFAPGGDDPTMAGHVRVEKVDARPADGEPAPPRHEELLEVRVTVAWRAHDGTDRRLDVVSRRTP